VNGNKQQIIWSMCLGGRMAEFELFLNRQAYYLLKPEINRSGTSWILQLIKQHETHSIPLHICYLDWENQGLVGPERRGDVKKSSSQKAQEDLKRRRKPWKEGEKGHLKRSWL